MKRVLIIASDFAPSSLPPATRVRFFAKHLPEFEWEPIVLTVDSKHYEATVDPENENLLAPSLKVIRTGAFSTRWTRKIGIGDIGMRSLWQHWRAIKRVCREEKIDLILIPVPPSVPMILGRLAHARFGIPYVIDYIDPWVTESYWRLPKAQRPPKWRASYWLARMLEPFTLRKVSQITGVSQGTTDSVISSYPWLVKEQGTEIPYGAEAADFEYVRQNPRRNSIFDPNDGVVHLSYVGAVTPAMYPAVRALFAGVRETLGRSAEEFARVRLHFIGTSYAPGGDVAQTVLALAKEAGVESLVTEHPGRIPYLESLQVMIDSHALLLIGSDEAHYTASKVFPYILSRRPLLAILHEESSAATILNETNACRPITFNSQRRPEEVAENISTRLREIVTSPIGDQPDTRWDLFERYTTKAMTARLAQALDKALENSRQNSQAKRSKGRKEVSQNPKPVRILIPFNTVSLYGMERGVIETFDLLRPEVEPHFLLSRTAQHLNLPVLTEIQRRGMDYSFFSDYHGWPRIGKPKSLGECWWMACTLVRGNLDVLKAARDEDFIYVAAVSYFYFILLAAVFHRLKRRRVIFHFHDLVSNASTRLRFTSWFVTDFVHNTAYGREVVRKSNPFVEKAKNWIIPFPIIRGERAEPSNDAAYFKGKGHHILFVGQVTRHKGIDVLLDAMAMIGKETGVLTLHIVGGCTDPGIEQRITTASNNGQPRVRYWGYQDDVLPMMKSADVYVHPSPPSLFQESFGRGVLEAMSVGTPTVCFKSGALQELMINEKTGLTCDEESAECLASGIKRLLVNNELRRRCGDFALRRYAENYSNSKVKALWLKCLGTNQEVTN